VGLATLFLTLTWAGSALSPAILLVVVAISIVILILFEIFSYQERQETAPFELPR
jgi:hypothetical protein